MPRASPRFSAVKASLNRVRDSGAIAAAPKPCSARAPISASVLGATAAAAEAALKMAMPTTNIRRRPNRSPRAAPVSKKTAKLRV